MPSYAARVAHESEGSWVAAAIEFPNTWSRGRTRDEALGKLRDEIRLRLEFCPCTSLEADFVQVEVAGERQPTPPKPEPAAAGPAVQMRHHRHYRWDD